MVGGSSPPGGTLMTISLTIFQRGKEKSEKLRKNGLIPGVIYGPNLSTLGENSLAIYASSKEFMQFYKNYESGLIEIVFVDHIFRGLIKEVQVDPLSNQVIHFDIYLPSLEKRIKAKVPIEFQGVAPATKKGGILSFNIYELEVISLPDSLPEHIIVDVSSLEEIGQAIRVKDLNLPSEIKILLEDNFPLVNVIAEEEGKESQVTTENTTQINE